MIPSETEQSVREVLSLRHGREVTLYAPSMLGGGSINQACRLRTSEGDYFLKWNDLHRYPGMFEKEARGLSLLSDTGAIRVPRVIHAGASGPHAYLLLEYLDPAREVRDYWEDFGYRLAQLHRNTGDRFGLDHDNYIGSLHQPNAPRSSWADFFTEMRLEVQVRLARDQQRISASLSGRFDRLYLRLPSIFPAEPASLLHGDLWSGNFMTDDEGRACLIDPAVYYGHREMDLAMSKLFGGFHLSFYTAYLRAWPLEKGWQGRVDICNLYPLMVHVNLFGGSYVSSVERILRPF